MAMRFRIAICHFIENYYSVDHFGRKYMQTDFKLYKVDMKYIRNIHNIDDKVFSVSPQTGKDNRIFIGIVIVCGSHKYCIPLSSPKEKHKNLQHVDTTIFKRDRENIRHYKKLCAQELEWCQANSEVICNKANVLYKKYISNEPFAGKNRCLNFPKLESECKKYNSTKKRGIK